MSNTKTKWEEERVSPVNRQIQNEQISNRQRIGEFFGEFYFILLVDIEHTQNRLFTWVTVSKKNDNKKRENWAHTHTQTKCTKQKRQKVSICILTLQCDWYLHAHINNGSTISYVFLFFLFMSNICTFLRCTTKAGFSFSLEFFHCQISQMSSKNDFWMVKNRYILIGSYCNCPCMVADQIFIGWIKCKYTTCMVYSDKYEWKG